MIARPWRWGAPWVWVAGLALIALWPLAAGAQDRAEKVRRDRDRMADDPLWLYNDWDHALDVARETGKPLLVVVRCVPCEACSQFDQDLLGRPDEVRELLDRFVCVRIIQANGLDLALFQFDYDQSFHILFLHPDGTIYGRYGTRSSRPEHEDMSMAGLRQAMLGALELHAHYPANRGQLAGKQGRPVDVKVPEKLPSLVGLYGPRLDYEGQLVRSCIHCHQIRDARRRGLRERNEPIPDRLLFPYPLPDVVGLRMDPDEGTRVTQVAEGSIADRGGLRPGDLLETLEGQPLISTADIQWVLHNAPAEGTLTGQLRRGDASRTFTFELDPQWRQRCDISWRPTTWDLRRMATGGMRLKDLTDDERRDLGLSEDGLALQVTYMGQFGEHAAGKRAGFLVGDVMVGAGDLKGRMTEGQFIRAVLPLGVGARLPIRVVRNQSEVEIELPQQ